METVLKQVQTTEGIKDTMEQCLCNNASPRLQNSGTNIAANLVQLFGRNYFIPAFLFD